MRWRRWQRDRWAFWGWVVLGLGVLFLVVGLPLSIWMVGRSDEPGSVRPSDSVSVTDTVELEFRPGHTAATGSGQPEPSGGGGSRDEAHLTDSVQFVVRDASGRIKEQGVAD